MLNSFLFLIMKLHLPKGLRTALLACMLAVSPAYAETLTTEAVSGLVFGSESNTGVTSSDVTTTNTCITFDAFADTVPGTTSSAQSWYLDLKFNAIAANGPSYSGSHNGNSAVGLSAYLNNGNGTICIAQGGAAKSATIPVVVGNTYRLAYDAVNHQVYLLDLTSSSSYRTTVADTGISNLELTSKTSWYWTTGDKNHATLIGGARIGADASSWTSLDFMQTIDYDPWLNQPMFGGPVYTYSTAAGGFKNAAGEVANPDRGGKGGPLLVFDSVGVVSAKNSANTSDYGGIKVTGHSAVSCDLGQWAGAIHVGIGSILNVSYGISLKNTESNIAANVYVDGLLNFVGRGDTIDLNDGNTFQNWHIGENGCIHLGSTVKNFQLKGNGPFHLEIVVNTKDEEISGLVNRGSYREINASRTIFTMAPGGNVFSTASSDYIIFDKDGNTLADATLSDGSSSVLVNYKKQGYASMELFTDSDVAWKNNGIETNTLFKDGNGVATSYRDGDSVTINGGTVTAQGNVSVSALSLNGGTLDLNSCVVNAHSLSIGGAVVVKEAAGQLLVGSLQASGPTAALTIDGTLTFCSPLVIEDQFTLTSGTLTLTGNNGTTLVQGGTLNIDGGTLDLQVTTNNGTSAIANAAQTNVGAGGTLKLTGHDMLGWGANSPEAINLKGSEGAQAKLVISDRQGSNAAFMTMSSQLVLKGHTLVQAPSDDVLKNCGISVYGSKITASGTGNEISIDLMLREANAGDRPTWISDEDWATARSFATFDVAADGELAISGRLMDATGDDIYKANVKKLGDGALIIKSDSSASYTGTWNIEEGTLRLETGAKVGTGIVNLTSGAKLESNGIVELSNTVTGSGSLSVLTGGKLTVSGSVTLGATIENAGALTLGTSGSLRFTSRDDLTPNDDVAYYDELEPSTSNGYSYGSYYIVHTILQEGSVAPTTTGISKVYLESEKDAWSVGTTVSGAITIGWEESVDLGGDYYIVSGDDFDFKYTATSEKDKYEGQRDNSAGNDKTTGLVIAAMKSETVTVDGTNTDRLVLDTSVDTTLVLKTKLNEAATKKGGGNGIVVRTNATIQLGDNTPTGSIVLNKATIDPTRDATGNVTFTPTLTLTGTGTYVMDKATKLDVDQTTFDSTAWSGNITVTDTELGGKGDGRISITDLNSLAPHSTATLEISGLSGYVYDATYDTSPTVSDDLKLADIPAVGDTTPAVAALTLTDAPENAGLAAGTLTLNGDLSGKGSIVNNSKGNVFLGGDISEWTGSYTASEASSVLTLAADAELNASVTGGSVTLRGALTLGKSMSLSGSLNKAGSITLKGDTLDAAKTAITVAGSVTGSGTLDFKTLSGDLSFMEALPDGSEFKLLSAAGGIAGYDKATVNGQESSTQTAADGTEVRYYIAMNDTSVTLSKVTLGLQWKGNTTDGWTTKTGFDQSSPLDENSIVSFTGGGSATVDVKENQVVKGIIVDAYRDPASLEDPDFVDTYTFTRDSITTGTLGIVHGNLVVQNNLTVNDLTSIHTGTSLAVEGEDVSLESEKMTNNGTLTIGSGSTVTVGAISGDGIVGGLGMLVVTSDNISADIIAKNTGTIELKTLDDTVATKGVQGTLLVRESGTFTGNYNSATSIGTMDENTVQTLAASKHLTVIGDAGTVSLTSLDNTAAAANKLGGIATKGETVLLNNVRDDAVANGTMTKVPTTVTLGSASRMEKGVLDFTVSAAAVNDSLTSADKPVVTTGAALSLKDVTLKVHEVQNKDLGITTGGQEKDIVLFVVNDTANDCEVDNVNVNMDDCPWMTKYFTNFRVVEGSVNVIGDANTGRYAAHGQTPNGTAGLALAGKAMFHVDPQTQNPDGELAQVLDMLDAHIESGNKGTMDKLGAALAGSSLSAVGLALADDVQRQLRSIRNRTTTMGVNECVVNEDMPYVNGWISGDGNYRQLSESGTDAGYQLSSWGGTVGVDVDVNPNLTLGVAVSALFGDYTGKAADTLTGDLDTQYVSLFARVSTGSWVNTFVGTLGRADVDLERTLPGIAGKTTYKTDGMMFGFLYEVARTFALNEDASTCVQPLFNMSFSHTSLDSATEGGTADTRLTTDSASLTQFSLGLGGRLQSVVGENEYNRASIFEARALLKLDLGDRYSKLNTALAALPTSTVSTRSNEKGVIGAEVGASLTIPISQDAGSVFFDVNADFNADQTGVNGSVGYRINF